MFTVPFTAPAIGDHGNAAVTVNVPADSITTSSVYISMTPNASTSYYYYLIYEDSDFAADNWNNDSVMNYFTTQAPKNYFELAGNFRVSPNENYTVYTLAYNIDSVTDGLQTYSFATQTIGGHGTPAVTVEIPADSVTATSFYVSFAPNSEVAHYYYTIIDSATVASMSWTADSVEAYMLSGDKKKYEAISGVVNELAPGTTYNVYTLAANLDGQYSNLEMYPVSTTVIGGTGLAEVAVNVEVVDGAATINTTMNDQTAYYYYAYFAGINGYDNDELLEMIDGNAQQIGIAHV